MPHLNSSLCRNSDCLPCDDTACKLKSLNSDSSAHQRLLVNAISLDIDPARPDPTGRSQEHLGTVTVHTDNSTRVPVIFESLGIVSCLSNAFTLRNIEHSTEVFTVYAFDLSCLPIYWP